MMFSGGFHVMRVRQAVVWFALALAPLVAARCSSDTATEKGPPAGTGRGGGDEAVAVTAAPAVEKAVPLDLQAIGTAEAFSNVAVHSQITGELTSVNFKEGDDVEKGQVLFTLDRRPLEAALQQAQANLERDIAQAANAESQAKRSRDLADRGIATREQVDTSAASATALQATVGADRAAVENARIQLQYATISAPLSGRTGALMVHSGNLVRANDTAPLVLINQVSPIYVSFNIPESDLPDLKKYLAAGSVRVAAQPPSETAGPVSGQITFIDNAVDQTTGTIRVKALFQNADHRLWPGQFVNVGVTLTTDRDATVVPAVAVQNGPQGTYVFVVKPDQTADLRGVEVARTHGSETILKAGVKPGEMVVTDGQLRLNAGTRVSLKSDSSKPEATKSEQP
jgi:multidrug efflux system membrane fusion protein